LTTRHTRYLLSTPEKLIGHTREQLFANSIQQSPVPKGMNSTTASAVILLLGDYQGEVCLFLNKRSHRVKQPGDLCCPGGGIRPVWDRWAGRLIQIPPFPLGRWPYWKAWRRATPPPMPDLPVMLAAALREGFEEMRLNPLGVKFLGILPPQDLVLFQRIIFPMVAWVPRQKKFRVNWEVEKMVFVPLATLLNPNNYRRFVLSLEAHTPPSTPGSMTLPCVLHETSAGREFLWGATYRIVVDFLETVFAFHPPPLDHLETVSRILDSTYLNGRTESTPHARVNRKRSTHDPT
jgi:8-oxo-dGTP pyrophosphatase MutT (NUDIX family)